MLSWAVAAARGLDPENLVVVVGHKRDQVEALFARAEAEFGDPVDTVVNNVGGAMPRPLLDTSPKNLSDAFGFNVANAHALVTAAVPLVLETAGSGSIINITSAMGRLPGRAYAAYGTAKAALAHYTRLSALDLAPRIRYERVVDPTQWRDEFAVQGERTDLGEALLEPPPDVGVGRGEAPLVEQGLEVHHRATDDHRGAPRAEQRFGVRELPGKDHVERIRFRR